MPQETSPEPRTEEKFNQDNGGWKIALGFLLGLLLLGGSLLVITYLNQDSRPKEETSSTREATQSTEKEATGSSETNEATVTVNF